MSSAMIWFGIVFIMARMGVTFGEYEIAPVSADMEKIALQVYDKALPASGVNQSSSFAWSRLAYICDTYGPRIAGSQALEDALDWIKATAESDGLRVTEEAVTVPKWVRGDEWAYMLTPRVKKLHMVGLGMSVGTGGKNITAPAFVVGGFHELMANCSKAAGKIVVFNTEFTEYGTTVSVRYNAGDWAAACNASGALIRSIAPFSMQNPHTGLTHNSTIPAAAISLEDASQLKRMQDRGQDITLSLYMESTLYPPVQSRNLLIDLVGSELPDEYVLVSGHGDSWDIGEGAMDDGGGFMAAWESVRLLKAIGAQPKRTIRAVVWVDEESGSSGGKQYVVDYNETGVLKNHSIAIESDSGAFTPLGLAVHCSLNDNGGCNATKAQLLALSPLLGSIGGGGVYDGEGGADIDPSCAASGIVCAGLRTLDQRLGTSGRLSISDSTNNPCTINAMSAWGVPELVNPSNPGYDSGYFFYHHSEADTIERIDPYQLNQAAAALAVWTYAIAQLPSLLPRDDVAAVNNNTLPPEPNMSLTTTLLIVFFLTFFIVGTIGAFFFVRNNDSEFCRRRGSGGQQSDFAILARSSGHGSDSVDL